MFLINKKYYIYREKKSSDTKSLIALILIRNICYSYNKNEKKQKHQNVSE